VRRSGSANGQPGDAELQANEQDEGQLPSINGGELSSTDASVEPMVTVTTKSNAFILRACVCPTSAAV
jgi:hypothetical protein